MKKDDFRLVYSTETGRLKPDKNRQAVPQPSKQPADGTIRLRREVKGRGGGTVIVITGLSLDPAGLKELAGSLKKRCGCGGTVKDGIIEIQGDHRDVLMQE